MDLHLACSLLVAAARLGADADKGKRTQPVQVAYVQKSGHGELGRCHL